jgi:hypothetical protein
MISFFVLKLSRVKSEYLKRPLNFLRFRTAFLLLLTLFFFNENTAATEGGNPNFRILDKAGDHLTFEWTAPELSWQQLTVADKNYVTPQMGALPLTQNPGQPQLPVDAILIEISPQQSISLTVLDSLVSSIPTGRICPSPSQHIEEQDNVTLRYDEDPVIYNGSSPFPHQFFSSELETWRDRRLLRIAIAPIQYQPKGNYVQCLRYMKAEIRFSTGVIKARTAINDRFGKEVEKMVGAKVGEGGGRSKNTIRITSTSGSTSMSMSTSMKTGWYDPARTYLKVLIVDEGVYAVSGRRMQEAGIQLSVIAPASISLLHRGSEQPCQVTGAEDGSFDADDQVVFFAERIDGEDSYYSAFSDTNAYWITWGQETGKRFETVAAAAKAGPVWDSSRHTFHLEQDASYYSGDTDSDIQRTEEVPGEGWIWHYLNRGDQITVPFDLPVIAWNQDSVKFRVSLRGTTWAAQSPDHHARISVNDLVLKDEFFNDREERIIEFAAPVSLIKNADNQIAIRSVDDTESDRSQFYLDWIDVSYQRKLTLQDGWLKAGSFDSTFQAQIFVDGLAEDSVTIWDMDRQRAILPQAVGKSWAAHIEVQSAGLNDGNDAVFSINGQETFSGARGYNLVVLDAESGAVIGTRNFDTWGADGQADSMAAFIGRVPTGAVVLAAIQDEGTSRMTEAAYQALESLGSAHIRQLDFRDSWGLIGRKGATMGTVPESHTLSGQGPAVVAQSMAFNSGGSTLAVVFSDTLKQSSDYVFFEPRGLKSPTRIALKKPSYLATADNGADYIIISHPAFQIYAQRLAEYRARANNFRTQVVSVQDIYDEFSTGLIDPQAIQDFVRFAYQNWQPPAPQYLLLFGDASWDPKQNMETSLKHDFIPSYGNPVSDLWFVCLDGPDDVLPEMHVGRLPVEDVVQAGEIVDKIMFYESAPFADWNKNFLFISGGFDTFEQSVFSLQSNMLAADFVQSPPASGNVIQLNKHSQGLQEGEHRQDILDILNAGVLWVNFIGHAGSRTWDLMFHSPDIDELANDPRYPFITSMTCHTGRFAEPDQISFGEHFVLAQEKGAIAFWGTSGWGYSYEDYLFLRKLFPVVLQDTVRQVGEAISLSKIGLWRTYGNSAQIRNLVLQYNLIGDPALALALPDKPDLALTAADISLDPLVPSEADSLARVKVLVHNFGLATSDSVEVALFYNHPTRGRNQIGFTSKLKSLGLVDSLTFLWPLKDMAGSVELEAIIDPNNFIAEANESNNRQTIQVTVLSSRIQLLAPSASALIPAGEVNLKVETPQEKTAVQRAFEFQLDTLRTFSSPFLHSSGSIAARPLLAEWKSPPLEPGRTFYWRVRNIADLPESFSIQSRFSTGENLFGWRQSNPNLAIGNVFSNVEWNAEGAQLALSDLVLLVQSQGLYNDTRYAVIQINADLAMAAGRGHNLVVINPENGNVLSATSYDLYSDPQAMNELAESIENLSPGVLVIDAIDDEGSGLNERALQALESLGSAQCRRIKFRDSWAIIGYKGAAIGSALESYMPNGTGPAILRDTLSVRAESGTILAPSIGPTLRWRNLTWQADVPSACSFSISVLGQSKLTGGIDTLISRAADVSSLDLSTIDAKQYPIISLLGDFSTEKKDFTPTLKTWQVTYDPVPDLATGPQVFSQSADTILVGEQVRLRLEVHNIGQAAADSVEIRFEESDAVTGRRAFAERLLSSPIPVDSSFTVEQAWSSTGRIGLRQLFVTIDPKDRLTELNKANNSLMANIYVRADTSSPQVEVTFDGRSLLYGEMVAARPVIIARIYDNSPMAITDTAAVQVLLDGQRIAYANNAGQLSLKAPDDDKTRALIQFTPALKDGDHTLEILASDASGNRIYHRDDFQVVSELRLLRVMNYPNPFYGQTDFTFELTQPAKVTIKVYTVAGRLIAVLDEDWLSAGFNAVRWDGRDQEGDALANGVYIYKVMVSNGSEHAEEISKLIVMR